MKAFVKQEPDTSRCLVVGAPRTGFTLLISVLIEIANRVAPEKPSLRRSVLRAYVDACGNRISERIAEEFAKGGVREDLLYNQAFRDLMGGPKWLDDELPGTACIRKYIGIRGMGDFTLVIRHPRHILDYHQVLHSHSHPQRWLDEEGYADRLKLASIRNPVGTINSSCFSINALASEYLTRFRPDEAMDDAIRQRLALYKLTDMAFFEGLADHLLGCMREFLECRERFCHVMGWEDLLLRPEETIMAVGDAVGLGIDRAGAGEIWAKIGYKNLTGAHRHNYRRGMAKVDGWKLSLCNEHLELLRAKGFDPICRELGYGAIESFNEREYTPYQLRVADYIARGEAYDDFKDRDLFGFAFNKSNLNSEAFEFKRYGWRDNTRVERSSFPDEKLLMKVWEAAEEETIRFNAELEELLRLDYSTGGGALAQLDSLEFEVPDAVRLTAGG